MIGNALSNDILVTPFLAEEGGFINRMFFPERASTLAENTDWLFFFIFWVSMFFFVILMGLMVVFAVKYRRIPGKPAQPSPSHNTALELSWSVIPLLLMVVMFIWGWEGYVRHRVPPANAETIYVEASQWVWGFTYASGAGSLQTETIADKESPVFALPVNRPVQFVLHSTDVIHSFYIPSFRVKLDVFPNRNTVAWAEPTVVTHRMVQNADGKWVSVPVTDGKDGFYLFCTEYCGDEHSQMAARIMIMEETDYQRWLAEQADTSSIPILELGQKLYVSKGCVSCHTIDGSSGTGPSWDEKWGTESLFADGGKATFDFSYVRESVLEPKKHIVQGFPDQMTSFQGRLTDREILALATFIKSLRDDLATEARDDSDREMAARQSQSETEQE